MKPTLKHSNPRLLPIGFALGLGTVLLIAAALTWFPEGDRPLQSDNSQKSLQKINDLLYGGGAGLTVQATFGGTVNTDTNMVLRSRTNNVYAEVEDGQVWVNVKTGTINTETNNVLRSKTNNVYAEIEDGYVWIKGNVGLTNPATGTTEANAVITTNQFTTALSNLVWQMIYHMTNGTDLLLANAPLTYSDIGSNGLGSAASKPVFTQGTAGTNQVSFSGNFTNLLNNITNAGVAGQVAWSATNSVFNVNGGDGLLQGIKLLVATNRDHTILCFNRIVTAQTSGSAVSLTSADMQYCVGKWSTTNTARWEAPTLVGTNYLYNIDCLATPIKNSDSSKNIMFVGLYLDTKSNYVANTSQIMFNMLLNQ